MAKHRFYIGIDTGTHTGVAIWDSHKAAFVTIKTMMIHQAMEMVIDYSKLDIMVRVEDARLRKWFGNSGLEKLQGAGSVKRDSAIWENFLIDKDIPYEMVAPSDNRTKLDKSIFQRIALYHSPTNEHGRDAAMLVMGIK